MGVGPRLVESEHAHYRNDIFVSYFSLERKLELSQPAGTPGAVLIQCLLGGANENARL